MAKWHDVEICAARPEMIGELWPLVWPYFEPAISEDFWTDEATLKQLLQEDKALLFYAAVGGVLKGGAVVQIEDNRDSAVNIVTLGGEDFKDWKDAMNCALTRYAGEMGCARIVALGRKGWEKFWPDFKPGKILFCKEIAA